jgi:hypothetical protein
MDDTPGDDYDDFDWYEDGDNYDYIEDGYAMAVSQPPFSLGLTENS